MPCFIVAYRHACQVGVLDLCLAIGIIVGIGRLGSIRLSEGGHAIGRVVAVGHSAPAIIEAGQIAVVVIARLDDGATGQRLRFDAVERIVGEAGGAGVVLLAEQVAVRIVGIADRHTTRITDFGHPVNVVVGVVRLVAVAIDDVVHPARVRIDVESGGFQGTATGSGWCDTGQVPMGVIAIRGHIGGGCSDVLCERRDGPITVVRIMQPFAGTLIGSRGQIAVVGFFACQTMDKAASNPA